jgi:hypothetical protein
LFWAAVVNAMFMTTPIRCKIACRFAKSFFREIMA